MSLPRRRHPTDLTDAEWQLSDVSQMLTRPRHEVAVIFMRRGRLTRPDVSARTA